jgi:hypothetical protein
MRISIRGAVASLGAALALAVMAADLGAPPIAGGWTPVACQSDQVILTAKYAVLEQARQSRSELKLLSIKHARQQVVAGSNFSMNLMVHSEGKRRLVIAVVWVKPDGSMELTRWHWV